MRPESSGALRPGALSQPQFLVRHVEETGHVIPGTAALNTKGRACRGRAPTVASPGDMVKDKGKVTSLEPEGRRERRKHLTAAQHVTGHHREGHGGSEETQRGWRPREGQGREAEGEEPEPKAGGGPRGGAPGPRERGSSRNGQQVRPARGQARHKTGQPAGWPQQGHSACNPAQCRASLRPSQGRSGSRHPRVLHHAGPSDRQVGREECVQKGSPGGLPGGGS